MSETKETLIEVALFSGNGRNTTATVVVTTIAIRVR